jgi:hypothetical protein
MALGVLPLVDGLQLELVADSMSCEDVAGVFGVGLELLAEREDEVVDGSW